MTDQCLLVSTAPETHVLPDVVQFVQEEQRALRIEQEAARIKQQEAQIQVAVAKAEA